MKVLSPSYSNRSRAGGGGWLGAVLLWACALNSVQAQPSCSANTVDSAYNDACSTCQAKAFTDIWLCNAWMPADGPTDPYYQACVQRANDNYAACVANLGPAPPQRPPDAPAPAGNPCSPPVPMVRKGPNSPVRRRDTSAPAACIQILDPVPDLQDGNEITTDVQTLATAGTPVTGIAADSAARVVLRIWANAVGDSLTLTLLNDQGLPSVSADEDGIIEALQPGPPPTGPVTELRRRLRRAQQATPQITLTAGATSQGPMAFAVYYAPANFDRAGRDDEAGSRGISFQVTVTSSNATSNAQATVWRGPVVLVHGLWGSPGDWADFAAVTKDPRFFVRTASYNSPLNVPDIQATSPMYTDSQLASATNASLGLAYNAPKVLEDIQKFILAFRIAKNAAATQADVVAHSMGGLVTRTLENLPRFLDTESFASGNIHKLITLGTPHLGSPLASQMLINDDSNSCLRGVFAEFGRLALNSVTMDDNNRVVTGGVNDLKGTGTGSNLSANPALYAISQPNGHEVPTAMIAGTMTGDNLAGLNCSLSTPAGCVAAAVRAACANSPLAAKLTQAGWPGVFGQDSDSVVPLTSQLDNTAPLDGVNRVWGIIHSSGMELLGFSGPTELDETFNVQPLVVRLLNMPLNSSWFLLLP